MRERCAAHRVTGSGCVGASGHVANALAAWRCARVGAVCLRGGVRTWMTPAIAPEIPPPSARRMAEPITSLNEAVAAGAAVPAASAGDATSMISAPLSTAAGTATWRTFEWYASSSETGRAARRTVGARVAAAGC